MRYFGVANNKQHVQLFELESTDYADEPIKPIWFILDQIVGKEIQTIIKRLGSRVKGTRTKSKSVLVPEENMVANIEKNSKVQTASGKVRESTSKEDLLNEAKRQLIDAGNPDPTDKQAEQSISTPVKLSYKDMGDNPYFNGCFYTNGKLLANNKYW